MNMQIIFISRMQACVSGNTQEMQAICNLDTLSDIMAWQVKSNLSYEGVSYDDLTVPFYVAMPQTQTVWRTKTAKNKNKERNMTHYIN